MPVMIHLDGYTDDSELEKSLDLNQKLLALIRMVVLDAQDASPLKADQLSKDGDHYAYGMAVQAGDTLWLVNAELDVLAKGDYTHLGPEDIEKWAKQLGFVI